MDRFSNILKRRLEATQSEQAAHPSSDTLVAFVEQGLAGSPRETVLAHLSMCPQCRRAVALATPAAATEPAAAQTPSSALRFPTAMRWASLAAGLAVAVGVGVIAYEHEASPTRQATFSVAQEKTTNPIASSGTVANESRSSNKLKSLDEKSTTRAEPHAAVGQKQELRRERATAKKPAQATGAILGALSTPAPNTLSKDSYDSHLKTLPSAPDSQFALKRDRTSIMQAASAAPALSQPASADTRASEEFNATIAGVPSKEAGAGNAGIAGSGKVASEQMQFVPAKTLKAVATSGSVAKTKHAYGVLGFVHWTISAAGKLQRRAIDGTLTVVEPLPGAIIRAVAAEGIEVWAGGLRSAPSPQNAQPRSLLFHSSDAGETWKTIDGPWQGSIQRVNLAGLGSITVVTTDGTWSTGDAGKSWSTP